MVLRRCRRYCTQSSAGNNSSSILGRYLELLINRDLREETQARQVKNEQRRISRRSCYKVGDDHPALATSSASRDVLDVNHRLTHDVNVLELSTETVTSDTLESLLRQCAATKAGAQGKRLHALMSKTGHMNNTYLANWIIRVYANSGCVEEALAVFNTLKRPNVFSWNIMITAYAQNGQLEQARYMFDTMPRKTVVSWNTMIVAYVQKGLNQEALDLFDRMDQEPSRITYIHVLQACDNTGALGMAERIHTRVVNLGWESDMILSTALFKVYARLGEIQRARSIFERMPRKDVVSWNTMVSAYARRGHTDEAMKLFMEMPVRNSASWNMMMTAYAQCGHTRAALGLFKAMDLDGVQPSKISFLAALSSCTSLADGRTIHLELVDVGFPVENSAGTALINMYGRCGSPEAASNVFSQLSQPNTIAWAALVAAYAHNGRGKEAVEFFTEMCLEGLTPNQINFVNVLHACSHGGLLKPGRSFFQSMISDHGLEPIFEHYACMVDLLGRTGRTERAAQLIRDMPFEPDSIPWMTLLAACKTHNDVERGTTAAEELLRLCPGKGAAYSLLANMFLASEEAELDQASFELESVTVPVVEESYS